MEVGIKKELHEKTNTAGDCCATPVVPRVSPHACKPSIAENMKFFWGKEGVGHTPNDSCAQSMVTVTRCLLTWIVYPAHCPILGVGYAGRVKSRGYSLSIQNPFYRTVGEKSYTRLTLFCRITLFNVYSHLYTFNK